MTFLFATVYLLIINSLLGFKTADPAAHLMEHGITWLGVIGLMAAYPAIIEELAFRGVIVPCLRRALTDKETIAVSAMMFMMLHLSVPSAPHLLLLGLIAAHLRLRTGSIWPCVLLHFTHNFLCVTFAPLTLN